MAGAAASALQPWLQGVEVLGYLGQPVILASPRDERGDLLGKALLPRGVWEREGVGVCGDKNLRVAPSRPA